MFLGLHASVNLSGALPLRLVGPRRPRRGSVLVLVILALVAILAATALTIDVGLMLVFLSRVQHVADACALAAAGGPMIGHESEVQTRIQQILDANNQQEPPITWNVQELVLYAGGQTVPGYGQIGPQDEAVKVRLRIVMPYMFARFMGLQQRELLREAIALRQQQAGGEAVMWALAPDANKLGIDISGSGATFYGIVHSNTKIDISGSGHRFKGVVEWVNRLRVTGSGTVFEQGTVESTVKPAPVSYQVSDFEPFDYVINGNWNISGSSVVVPPGVYRVYGNVHVSGSNVRMENVTIVADGYIRFSGSGHYYSANRHNVFAFTLSNDSTGAIHVSGAGPNCRGTLYAPNGNIDFSGSGQTFSSLIGWTIDISGSGFTLRPSITIGSGQAVIRLIG